MVNDLSDQRVSKKSKFQVKQPVVSLNEKLTKKINGLFKFEMDPRKNRWYCKTTIVLILLLTSPKLIILR